MTQSLECSRISKHPAIDRGRYSMSEVQCTYSVLTVLSSRSWLSPKTFVERESAKETETSPLGEFWLILVYWLGCFEIRNRVVSQIDALFAQHNFNSEVGSLKFKYVT